MKMVYEDGLVADTVVSGIDLTFGTKWKVDLVAGRVGADSDEAHYGRLGAAKNSDRYSEWASRYTGVGDDTDLVRIGVQYDDPGDKGLFGGVSYVWAKDKDFGGMPGFTAEDGTVFPDGIGGISKSYGEDKASVYTFNLGYRFNEKFKLWGSVGRNSKATSNTQKTSWQIEARYGNYGDLGSLGRLQQIRLWHSDCNRSER